MRAATRGLQALALVTVASLLGVLVWRVAHRTRAAIPAHVDPRHPVTAPGFDLPRLDGPGRLTLASLRGKAVVVNFWASWCYPCKQEMRALEAAWRRHRDRGVVFVGIDVMDGGGDALSLARRMGVTYPIVRDDNARTFERYAGANLPETFFVSRRGRVVTAIEGGVQLKRNRDKFNRGIELAARA
jgi:cytochrome c biogenesis protein CcmG, thiol:disulfide interchange protein DsbE